MLWSLYEFSCVKARKYWKKKRRNFVSKDSWFISHHDERRLFHFISVFIPTCLPDVCNHLANKFNFSSGRNGRLYPPDFVHLSWLGSSRLQQCLPDKCKDGTGAEVDKLKFLQSLRCSLIVLSSPSRYNDISPLENHHCSIAFRLLEFPDCNLLENITKDMYK